MDHDVESIQFHDGLPFTLPAKRSIRARGRLRRHTGRCWPDPELHLMSAFLGSPPAPPGRVGQVGIDSRGSQKTLTPG